MFVKTVNLWENTPGLCEEIPTLDIYVPENKTSDTAVVILPAGGRTHDVDLLCIHQSCRTDGE